MLSQYTLGTNTAEMHVRNLPNADFTTSRWMYLNDNEFHTFAVEVTPDHISWFVDTKVIRTERRPAALEGVALMPPLPGAGRGRREDEPRSDADGLDALLHARSQERAVDQAPALTQTTYAPAC